MGTEIKHKKTGDVVEMTVDKFHWEIGFAAQLT
jgi:hypothetical protein